MGDPILDDPDIIALRDAAAAKRRNVLIAVAVAILVPFAYWLQGFSAVRTDLERDSFTEIEISAAGAFEYKFDANKGPSKCKGRVSRLPFSSSRNVSCSTLVDRNGQPLK